MLKLLIPLSYIFFLSGPALADFGSADTSGSKGNEISTFKAKCCEEHKACNIKIDFEGGKVIVDKTNYDFICYLFGIFS